MRKVNLGDVATIAISNVDKKTVDGEIPVKLCNFVDVYHNWAVNDSLRDALMGATAKPNQVDKFSLKKGQVAITKDSETRDDIGIATYIADTMDNVVLGYHTALITPDETEVNGKYLNAYLHSPIASKYFEHHSSGSGQRYTLTDDIIAELPLYLPDLATQEEIGELFSSIDRAIKNKQVRIEKLEEIARLIYDYWFTQFDFPNENGKPYRSSGGKMVWNEELKHEVPEGWRLQILGRACTIKLGGTPDTDIDEYWDGNIPWLSSAEIANNPVLDSDKYITELGMKKSATEYSPAGSVALSITRYLRASILAVDSCFNQSVVTIEENELLRKEYLFPFIVSQIPRYMLLRTGAQQPHINKETVAETVFVLPPKNVLAAYYRLVSSLYKAIINYAKEEKQMTSLRDWLLPMLMNGQAKVS